MMFDSDVYGNVFVMQMSPRLSQNLKIRENLGMAKLLIYLRTMLKKRK